MKIAIHNRKGSFSERWISYCEKENIPYKVVNCYHTNIIADIADCDALMWHHHQTNFKDTILAKQLLYSLEHAGKIVFPNFHTGWHFDDKLGQKYLFEALGVPSVPSYVFYDEKDAKAWIKSVDFPKVFKLRGGASSLNVRLVRSRKEAYDIVKQAFGKGFSQFNRRTYLEDKIKKFQAGLMSKQDLLKGIARAFLSTDFARKKGNEKGYVYFQDFIPNEGYDIRVIVTGGKAVSVRRLVRKGDFRASGSGQLIYDNEEIDVTYIKLAFQIAKDLKSQCIALDFMRSYDDKIFLVEVSYGFPMLNFIDNASGYWDVNLKWYPGDFNLQGEMVEAVLNQVRANQTAT